MGYLYVGRVWHAVAFAAAPIVLLFVAAWTRWIVTPVGWYGYLAIAALIAVIGFAHPIVIAWRRPLTPAKACNRWWWYVAWIVGIQFSGLIVPSRGRLFGSEAYNIPSSAMSPTLQPGDHIVVDAWRYGDDPPSFGDIVVYRDADGINLVKRVVGVPGDALEMRERVLWRNGMPVDEPYLRAPEPGARSLGMAPTTLGADEFFVLGDYRDNSMDSRVTGPVERDSIVGRVEFISFSMAGGAVHWDRFARRLGDD